MQRIIREKSYLDRSSIVAYAGVGAAIAFIAAMTFGAIDAPQDKGRQWTAPMGEQSTRVVSATDPQGAVRLR